jgi:hypothetical protein
MIRRQIEKITSSAIKRYRNIEAIATKSVFDVILNF